MPTVRASLDTLEASLFVDRQPEMDEFVRWLGTGASGPVLQVIGHAGVGKSALLHAFARAARTMGRHPVLCIDGEMIDATAVGFTEAVTGDEGTDVAAFLENRPALLIIDALEKLAPLTRWLTTALLPSLGEQVRVVVAGRQPVGPMWTSSFGTIPTIRLESLTREASSEYLKRRGVSPHVSDQILGATGGYPLALSLAADLAIQRGVTRFKKAPEWNLTLRSLVDELLREAPELQPLLEAAAVVRQFDEPILDALTGLVDSGPAFAALCAASFVRPAQHGLTLHDDVRRVVVEELGWRNPERLAQLQRRARAYYRDRIRQRRAGEEWLVAERVYLREHSVLATYFPTGEPWTMWVENGGPADLDELQEIQADFISAFEAGVPLMALPPPEECSPELLRNIVALPGTEVRIARSADGRAHGYGFTLPVSQAALAILPPEGALATVVERGLSAEARRDLPPTHAGSRVAYMSAAIVRGERAPEALGALAGDWFRYVVRGGVLLACTGDDTAAQVAAALGAVRIPEVGTSSLGPPRPLDGYVFDSGRIGPDAWLEAVTSGLPLPPVMSDEELTKELHGVLVGWPEDARLAKSPLAQLARLIFPPDEATSAPEHLRSVVRASLAEVRASDHGGLESACRALELAYFDRKLAHEAIAERLGVPRTTFYRMLHRAEREIAARFVATSS